MNGGAVNRSANGRGRRAPVIGGGHGGDHPVAGRLWELLDVQHHHGRPHGSSTSETTSSTTTSSTTTTAPTSTSTTATAAVTSVSCPTTGSATVCEFYSPTHNISCEIDPTEELCLTANPAQAAHLQADGSYTTCTGETCLSNAGLNTGILAYGTSTSNGTFTCVSRQTGVTCTASGKGFTISTSGIRPATA